MNVNVTTLAELAGLLLLIVGTFFLGARFGVALEAAAVALGVALLYEARP